MLSLEQIKMMVLAAELGSFSACARKMGKVQSAVSHGISTLEIDLGVELFDRSSRNPKLTVAGERLIRSARNLLAQADEFQKIAQSIEKKEEGALTIAIDDGVTNKKLAELFKRLDDKFPSTQIDVLTMASTDICQEITSNNVDLRWENVWEIHQETRAVSGLYLLLHQSEWTSASSCRSTRLL